MKRFLLFAASVCIVAGATTITAAVASVITSAATANAARGAEGS